MKALSVRQPDAARIVRGKKTAERRTWPTDHRGPLLIHAASFCEHIRPEERGQYVFGALVGVVDVIDCWPDGDTWHWTLDAPRVFNQPIPWPGHPRLFDVPDDAVADAVRDATLA